MGRGCRDIRRTRPSPARGLRGAACSPSAGDTGEHSLSSVKRRSFPSALGLLYLPFCSSTERGGDPGVTGEFLYRDKYSRRGRAGGSGRWRRGGSATGPGVWSGGRAGGASCGGGGTAPASGASSRPSTSHSSAPIPLPSAARVPGRGSCLPAGSSSTQPRCSPALGPQRRWSHSWTWVSSPECDA